MPDPNDTARLDAILSAYERGVLSGQCYDQTVAPYPAESAERYAFLRGMGHGMKIESPFLRFEGRGPQGKSTKAENFNGS